MTPSSSPSKTTISLRLSKAELVLVFITMLWGGTFLLVHNVMTVSGPMFSSACVLPPQRCSWAWCRRAHYRG